jgi:signal transduction histidine kinase
MTAAASRVRRPLSFGTKLTLGFVGVAIVAILVVTTPTTVLNTREATQSLRDKAVLYARLIGPQLRPVVAFDDQLTAREVFAPFEADADIAGIAVYTSGGQVIEGYGKYPDRVVAGEAVQAPAHRVLVISQVVSKEGPTGHLAVVLSTESVDRALRRHTLTTALLAGAALVLAAIIAVLLARPVTARLRRIAGAANKVADGDLEQPEIQAGAQDEIGHLVGAFNVMVERLRRQFAERKQLAETEQSRLEDIVATRTGQLEESREQYRLIAESTHAVPFTYLPGKRSFAYIGPRVQQMFGHPAEAWMEPDFLDRVLVPGQRAVMRERVADLKPGAELELECSAYSSSGEQLQLRWVVTAGEHRGEVCLRGLMLDITQQRKLESDLQQAQKLESVGRLASGVAHEINTPIQFVSDNVHFLRDATNDLLQLIAAQQAVHRAVMDDAMTADIVQAATRAEDKADLPYLLENIPPAYAGCIDGLKRVATIVRSMKEFAHPDSTEMASVDLNRAIESTLTIAKNEYKYVAEVETDFAEIPDVLCYAGDVNQAVLNIVVNAAHAIGDIVKSSGAKGLIRVSTRRDGDCVVVSIADTGGGIPEHIRARIFDPFFTTKEVGKGTGQGLAIARSVIVEKHGGELTLECEMGKGSTFHIRLPIDGKKAAGEARSAA